LRSVKKARNIMVRPRSIEEPDLVAALARVFADVGYEGASLARLAQATGLQKASLYHRFPRGKQQMADEVLAAAGVWLQTQILGVLNGPGTPRERLGRVAENLDSFYKGGRQACLLNMLSSSHIAVGPFAPAIQAAFEALIDGLAGVAAEAGLPAQVARRRAERVVMMLQGSLVMSRGMGTTGPFRSFLDALPAELIAAS
jgi:TetR/AcrR family transcriptional regulator, lmrAB and yxaGH operons repressor